MADENDLSGKVGLDTTDFKAGVSDLNRQIRVIETGFKAAAAGMDSWSDSEEGLQERINALNQITDLQKQKVQNLTDQYEKMAKEKGENSKEAQNLQVRINNETAALNKNLKELDGVTSKLNDFGKETQEAVDNIDDLSKASDETSISLKGMAGEILKAEAIKSIASYALDAAKTLIGFSMDSQKAMNNFQAQTGIVNDSIGAYKDIMEEIYADNFGESFEDIAQSMAEINQITFQTGDSLKSTTEQALLMRDTFGFDVKESINTVNGLMKNFGITAEEAYTLLAQGAQNGANKNGDLLDIMNEYSVQFAALGLSAEDFTNILIDGAQNGAFSIDKIGDAMKEFSIRAIDGSKTSADAFKSLGFNADEMFNKFAKGGPEASAAFFEVIKKLSGVQNSVEQNQIGVALFGSMWEDLRGKAINALGDISDNVNMSADTLQQMNDIKYDDIGSALEGLKRQLLSSLNAPLESEIKPQIESLISTLQGVDLTPVVSVFGFLIENGDVIAGTILAIGTGFIGWKVGSAISALGVGITSLIPALNGAAVAQQGVNVAMKANPIGAVISIVSALTSVIMYLWATNEDFRNFFINAWDDISNTGEWAINTVSSIIQSLPDKVAGIPGKISSYFTSIDWGNVGWSIIQGIADGMGVGPLVKAARNAAASALDTIKDFLGIHSPSRVMRDQVGSMIGAGMAIGIEDSSKEVNNAMSALNKQVVADGNINLGTNSNLSTNSLSSYGTSNNSSISNGEPYVIIQPVVVAKIDSKTVARVTAPEMAVALAKIK